MVLRNLAEVVTAYVPALPENRRKELQLALITILPTEMLPFCMNVLAAHVPGALQQSMQDQTMVLECLALVEAFSEYSGVPVMCDSNMLQSLGGLLNSEAFCVPVLKIYTHAVNKKCTSFDAKYHPIMVVLWASVLQVAQVVLESSSANPDSVQERAVVAHTPRAQPTCLRLECRPQECAEASGIFFESAGAQHPGHLDSRVRQCVAAHHAALSAAAHC